MSLSTTLRLPPTIAEMVGHRDRAVAHLREAGRCIDQAAEAALKLIEKWEYSPADEAAA